jgi:hypothetical protein
VLFPESGPKTNVRVNGFTKTVTLRIRSIGPNVQRHMAYFALITSLFKHEVSKRDLIRHPASASEISRQVKLSAHDCMRGDMLCVAT